MKEIDNVSFIIIVCVVVFAIFVYLAEPDFIFSKLEKHEQINSMLKTKAALDSLILHQEFMIRKLDSLNLILKT
jgi:hypothetical protein